VYPLIETIGLAAFVAECDRMAASYGPRFAVSQWLRERAANGAAFTADEPRCAASSLSRSTSSFRDSVRRFMQKEIAPHAARWREQGYVDRWAFTKAGEQGYLLMWADEKYGGAAVADFRYSQIRVRREHARGRSRLLPAAALRPGCALHRRTRHGGAEGALASRLRSRGRKSWPWR